MDSILKVADKVYRVSIIIVKLLVLIVWTSCFFICTEIAVAAAVLGIVVLLVMSLM